MPSAVKQALRALAFECGCGARRRRRRRRGEALLRRLVRCWKNPTKSASLPRGALCLFSRARGAISRAEASQDAALFTRNALQPCEPCALHT